MNEGRIRAPPSGSAVQLHILTVKREGVQEAATVVTGGH